ncbi:MAG TPA: dTDP-4-dehydrorhamnose reductase [Patescibacteria group bacterium]
MRIFLTGAQGQLGKACQAEFATHKLFLADIDTCDITDSESCRTALESFSPDLIIHTAAYTNVKQAEVDPDVCYRVNLDGTYNLARYARAHSCRFVYISTDFVFGGESDKPYNEHDAVNPQSVYARSKLAGELLVQDLVRDHYILRTAWLYGAGKNFVQTIITLAQTKEELPVVSDQYGTPTYAVDLAHYISQVLQTQTPGIYHATNEGSASWADFAREILRLKGLTNQVIPITTQEAAIRFSDPTVRPAYSVLNKDKLKRITPVRKWQEALQDYLSAPTTRNK